MLLINWSSRSMNTFVLLWRTDVCEAETRSTVVVAHRSGKGLKVISKQIRVHHSVLRKIIHT